ncbi:predicted protein [Uncinocarpus reesii 1704]|uniref:Cytochrome b561 domain-containing protein n=1 Tax=Uncinocarpus reesii (strain UAMH 1704) TaxID=336963 RepID=C4JYJ7_UNCRE|nr:uncharacterized protein UREG_07248 [Uncinocarpus reesii 1704]EEP82383.1 predicted protein [Uncinocarpus reesii 1704]
MSEHEPLLGRPGDVSQPEHGSIIANLATGTAPVAQAGIWILAALVWSAVFTNDLIFFSPHPLLNSAGVLLSTQAILLLQPTHTAAQKRHGALAHFGVLLVANLAFIAALVVIEINKASHPETRFKSVHAILGLVAYILIFLQAAVGVAQYFFPARVFGSVDAGKSVYKWHRLGGYVVFVVELATIAAATQTDYNRSVLHIRLWTVLLSALLVVAGLYARIKRHKLPPFLRGNE